MKYTSTADAPEQEHNKYQKQEMFERMLHRVTLYGMFTATGIHGA